MELTATDFELFGLPARHAQERSALDAQWRRLQEQVHPDRFAAEGAAAQRVAMQWTVRVNEAYQRLKDPLRRAAYLCEINGAAIDAGNNAAMAPDFLMQQMAWREALAEADGADAVELLAAEVGAARKALLAQLGHTLDDERDFARAAQQVRALMFVERFAHDVDQRLQALET
ncbi:MAG: Fe-S protein assembly co-chaperone HscB [Ideonella sp.]|nr:Fe-S protein assembly co-chaperone HscB [Ideonella sp.]